MFGMMLTREYKGYRLVIEESGNVSIYSVNGKFLDKLANMSEAKRSD